VPTELERLLERLEQERQEADRLYNDALTALDQALQSVPPLPATPRPYDRTMLGTLNETWNVLPDGAPVLDRSIKGRLRGLIWRLVGPPLEAQQRFNAALVDHLNRNAAAHEEATHATIVTTNAVRQSLEGLVHFQARLLQYLQTVTLYVDTRNRSAAAQAKVLSAGVSAIADDWLKRWESQAATGQRQQAAVNELQATATLAQQTALALKREVERLLSDPPAPGDRSAAPAVTRADLDAFKYLGFENLFRGSPDDIRERLSTYVPYFEGAKDVLDVGCGRGEFLELLGQRGIAARGLDLNHEMVEASRARGLDVAEGDALGYLTDQPDGSLGGLFAAQVVEHLEPDYLMRVLETAFHKVRPGGVIVLETINVACWAAFFDSYVRDLTHVRPLHPDTLAYLLRVSGFQDVRIEMRSPVSVSDRLQRAPEVAAPPELADTIAALNENVDRLNARLFTSLDYAAVARR